MRIYNWNTIYDFFNVLNNHNVKYVVMRNFEDMDKEDFFVDGHEDIDVLCEDVSGFLDVSKIFCKMIPEDDIHFVTFISGKTVPVDLRHLGDNYYDCSWEKDILARRRMADNGNWYVMSAEDYYYTLIYHAILQKSSVNPQYIDKLNVMAKGLGISADDKEDHLKNLDSYMNKQGYQYIQPDDTSVPFQWKYIGHAQRRLSEKETKVVGSRTNRKSIWGGYITYRKSWVCIHT